MKAPIYTRFTLIILLFAGMVISTTACYRKKDTIAKVYVVDQNNQRVPGAVVRLVADPTVPYHNPEVADKVSSTNRSGEAIFIYNDVFKSGQAGVAVMKIKVEYAGAEYESIIKIDQETTSEKTVII